MSKGRAARAIALVSYICCTALAQSEQPPPYRWPRSRDYDVRHYRIALSFDWKNKAVFGEATITLRPFKSGLREIELDAGNMTISGVRLANKPLQFRYEDREKLFVKLDRDYPAGTNLAITVSYSAVPKKGLTFIVPTEREPNRPYQIWSQGQPEDNHYWFPCYDYPNDKATSELIVTVQERFQVISNGKLVSVRRDPIKKTKTWHWKMDQPSSSYLISVIVGEFARIRHPYKNLDVSSYVYRDQVENARLSFANLSRMIRFFSEKLQYEYPYGKYAQTTVRDFGGGMENITATTLTDSSVHDERAALDISSDGLVSHELAHQWFGDMLTCRDWGELWLNESFATFMANLWTEHDKGRDEYLYEMFNNQRAYFQAWSGGLRRPIVTRRYEDPDSLFDAYAYPRGAAVLHMLRFTLGEELFWRAIRHYLRKHRWDLVETQNLIQSIEEATGQNLQWFFDQWVYKIGHPEFEIKSNYDEASKRLTLNVKQTQAPDQKRPWFQSPDFFTTQVEIAITTGAGERVHRVLIDAPEKEFSFQLDSKPLIINFDRNNNIIKQVRFERSDQELAYQLLHDADVTGRLRAAAELGSRRSETALEALKQAALRDGFWGVRLEATRSLAGFKTEASRAALMQALKDKNSRIRRAALEGLAAFKDPSLADLYIATMKEDPSYFAVAEAARALGHSGAKTAYEALVELLKRDSWQDTIRAGAIRGLAALKDARALDIGLKYAAPGNKPTARAAAFELLAEIGNGNDRALQALTHALEDGSPIILQSAISALARLADPRAIPALEELAKTEPSASLKKQIADAINQIKGTRKEQE